MAKPVVVTKKSPWEGLRRVTSLTDVRLVEGQGPWNDGKVNVDAIVNSQPSCVDLKSLPPVATCVVLVLVSVPISRFSVPTSSPSELFGVNFDRIRNV